MNYYDNSIFYHNPIPNRNFPNTIIYPRFNKIVSRNPSLNITKILDTTQRGINTINQIVPLYKQVTPIIKQVANFTKSINSYLFKRGSKIENNNIKNTTSNSDNQSSYRTQDNENTPFFNKK